MENTSEHNDAKVQFILTDLDVALTFMDVARVTGNEETRRRNHENARTAYATISQQLKTAKLDALQQKIVDEKLTALRTLLQAVSEQAGQGQ